MVKCVLVHRSCWILLSTMFWNTHHICGIVFRKKKYDTIGWTERKYGMHPCYVFQLGIFIYFMNFPLDQKFCHMHAVRFCIYDQNWNVYGIWYHTFSWSVCWLVGCFLPLSRLRPLSSPRNVCMLDLSLLLFAWCLLMRAFIHCCLKCLNITKRKQRKFYTLRKWIHVLWCICAIYSQPKHRHLME